MKYLLYFLLAEQKSYEYSKTNCFINILTSAKENSANGVI